MTHDDVIISTCIQCIHWWKHLTCWMDTTAIFTISPVGKDRMKFIRVHSVRMEWSSFVFIPSMPTGLIVDIADTTSWNDTSCVFCTGLGYMSQVNLISDTSVWSVCLKLAKEHQLCCLGMARLCRIESCLNSNRHMHQLKFSIQRMPIHLSCSQISTCSCIIFIQYVTFTIDIIFIFMASLPDKCSLLPITRNTTG